MIGGVGVRATVSKCFDDQLSCDAAEDDDRQKYKYAIWMMKKAFFVWVCN